MTLYQALSGSKKDCPLTLRKHIRPEDIHDKITVKSVEDELPPTWWEQLIPCWDRQLEQKVQRASRVIAILVLLDKHDRIGPLLRDGLIDDHLPLVRDGDCLRSHCGAKSFKLFSTSHGYGGFADMFLETQWVVRAPILDFETSNSIIPHIHLEPSATLPLDCTEVGTTAYSVVYKATPWPLHYKGIKVQPHGKVCMAVKQFKVASKDNPNAYYHEELANLKQVQKFEHEHLNIPLAYCDQARSIFFPWADGGDLWKFWEANNPQKLERTSDTFLWALRQITGLTRALELIHEDNTRHGDLKPSNILHFTGGATKLGILKIADFGVSRTHKIATGLRQSATITKASTIMYEAPEAHNFFGNRQSRSRKYDCWSMGCIMLEFVMWLLYDSTAISNCMTKREPPYQEYYRPIAGVDAANHAIEDAMEVHPIVIDAVEEMKDHIWFKGTAMGDIVTLVTSNLLRIKPEERLGAGDTHQRLQTILSAAQDNLSPFTKKVDPKLPVPPLFSQPAKKPLIQATYQQHP
ncbi:kinase-like domain-containing protein [Nemania sp. NC0429]|nr:kinase-like domain-containing protein [Nemania sp. NC0429]